MKENKTCSDLKKNSLSTVKLVAALQVAIVHILTHLELSPPPPAILKILAFFGGVPIFFAISGMLIWFSVKRSKSSIDFYKKRLFRIYPELWVGVGISLITILVLYRGWNLPQLLLFAVTQGTVLQFWTPNSLRGYGCGTPNGSLWTICVTIQFYLIVWFLYKIMHKRKWILWIGGFILCVCTGYFGSMLLQKLAPAIIAKLYSQTILRHLWFFFLGCLIAEFYETLLPFLSKFWYVFLALALIPHLTGLGLIMGDYNVLQVLFLVPGVIGFAYRFPRLALKTDISYGLFIYHMIIVNVMIHFGWVKNFWYGMIALLLSCLLAYASTKTVGTWSARKKQKM